MRISGPSCESVNGARKYIMENTLVELRHVLKPRDHEAIDALLAATAPPSDVPRPADMAELARMVAKELRHRGVPAFARVEGVIIWRLAGSLTGELIPKAVPKGWLMFAADFDNLTPGEIATVIQHEEAAKLAQLANDI